MVKKLTSSFIFQPGIKVNLPKAVTGEIIQKENLIIVIDRSNKIYVDERAVNNEELKSRLNLASRREQPVLIKADRRSEMGEIVRVWDLCRQENVKKINIATTQEGI